MSTRVTVSDALVKFAQVSQPLPYQMALQVHTPQGYPLTVTVQKANAEELISGNGEARRMDGCTRLHTLNLLLGPHSCHQNSIRIAEWQP